MTSYCCSSSCDLTARVRRGVSVYHEKSVECTRRCDRFSASSRFLDNERTLREEGRVLGEKKKKKKKGQTIVSSEGFSGEIFFRKANRLVSVLATLTFARFPEKNRALKNGRTRPCANPNAFTALLPPQSRFGDKLLQN